MKLVCGVDQTVEKVVARSTVVYFLGEQRPQSPCVAFARGSGENHTVAFPDVQFEIARHIEIFIRGIAALLLFGIFDATIPVWLKYKIALARELHIKFRIAGIQAGLDAVVHFLIISVDDGVLVRKLSHAPKGQKRFETQRRRRVGIEQRVTNQDAVLIVLKYHFLLHHYSADAVDGGRHLVAIVRADIFVPIRAVVVALILMQTEVESRSVLNDSTVERR
ncbi:hypothetical protein HMPREF1870_01297 [Bacteroidales bacterium KA00344]|nr:hypothetical protein HMPREF1870_01297 [Bacteroidales bacterium KA00344]